MKIRYKNYSKFIFLISFILLNILKIKKIKGIFKIKESKLLKEFDNNYIFDKNNKNINLSLINKKIHFIDFLNKYKLKKKIIENEKKNKIINLNMTKKELSKKIFWKNENIDIDKIKKSIINYNKYKNISDLKNYFYEKQIPKVSLIITLYNQVKFIPKIYACIQEQTFHELEIIFINDSSEDNPLKMIKKLMEKDKRIIFIQNSINKGQFYTRNKAALFAKGEYILIIDPDDLLLNNIIAKTYMTAKYYNLDIVNYHHMVGNVTNNTFFKKKIFLEYFINQKLKIYFLIIKIDIYGTN